MRTLLTTSIVLLFLSSCITSNHVYYSDPNYLGSSEFSSYDDIVTKSISEIGQTQYTDTITDNYYQNYNVADDYYDYSFSSRIRRFHRPMYYSNYYGGLYTDYYWYNNDPFYCGTSIYYGYNWNSPYYSYYSYSPYYYNNYSNYYSYGHNHYNYNTPTYTYSNTNTNNYTTGHRGSLSSHSIRREVKKNTIIPNSNTSTLNINHKNTLKKNSNTSIRNTVITTKDYIENTNNKTGNGRGNTSIKTNTDRTNTNTKTNNSSKWGNTSTKTTRSYTTPKSNSINNKSYSTNKSNSSNRSYNSGNSKSNTRSRASGGSNRRNVKPRK